MLRPRVYIASPYSASHDRRIAALKSFSAGRDVYEAGGAPLMPLLAHYLAQGDNHDNLFWQKLTHRDWVEEYCLPWVAVADAVLRLPGESAGADQEVTFAIDTGIIVLYTPNELREFMDNWKPVHPTDLEQWGEAVKCIDGGGEAIPVEECQITKHAQDLERLRRLNANLIPRLEPFTYAETGSVSCSHSEASAPANAAEQSQWDADAIKDRLGSRFRDVLERVGHAKSVEFMEILVEAAELHVKKASGYGTDDDPIANVRASVEFGVPGWQGVGIRMNDKLLRLKSFARNGRLDCESAADSLIDLLCYSALGLILLRETEAK